MELGSVLAAIEIAVGSGNLGVHVLDWFRKKAATGIDAGTQALLRGIPESAPPETVASIVREFYARDGGDLTLTAGNDGGGDLHIRDAHVEAGSGTRRGGDLMIKGGDGGPHGKGGDTVIIGGTYKAGDAI